MPVAIIDPTRSRVTSSTDNTTGVPMESPRVASLAGLRVGLLENTKRNAAEILDAVGALLASQQGAGTLVRLTKKQFAMPLPDDMLEELRRECDVVVVGVGDCGSCSAAAVADGIALERAGIPTAVICTEAFVATSTAMAALKGRADYPFLVTEHPVANLGADGIDARADVLVTEVVSRLTRTDEPTA